ASRSVLTNAFRSITRLLAAVEVEKDVLEVGLVAVDAEDAETGERLDQRVGLSLEREEHGLAVPLDLAHPGDPCERGRGRSGGEGDLDARKRARAQLIDRSRHDEPPVADQRDAVGD